MVVNDDDISSDIKSKIFSILINKNIVVKVDDKGIKKIKQKKKQIIAHSNDILLNLLP